MTPHTFDQYQKIKAEVKEELMQEFKIHFDALVKSQDEIKATMADITATLEPISKAFNSVDGFNRIGVMLLKGMVLFGAAIGGLYAVIEFLKRVGRGQ